VTGGRVCNHRGRARMAPSPSSKQVQQTHPTFMQEDMLTTAKVATSMPTRLLGQFDSSDVLAPLLPPTRKFVPSYR
jgi:hypothetical protein